MSDIYNKHTARSNSLVARLFIALVKAYKRYLSPLHRPCCIYEPSCSTYALQAIERYGAAKGGWLALRRIARCHPFHKGGFDPVP